MLKKIACRAYVTLKFIQKKKRTYFVMSVNKKCKTIKKNFLILTATKLVLVSDRYPLEIIIIIIPTY